MNKISPISKLSSGDLWSDLLDGLARGDLTPARDSLEAGSPIYYSDASTDDAVIKEYPDGRRESVRFDADGEHLIKPLP